MNDSTTSPSTGDILIIDDEVESLQLLSNIMDGRGYDVRFVTHGAMGLVSAAASLPDLILLDIVMPGMDGYEICQRLKTDKQTCDIPVIFISSLDEFQDILKGFQCGGVDYITKPFRKEEVCARVDAHMQLRRLTKHLDELVHQRTAKLDTAYQRLATLERAKFALLRAETAGLRSTMVVVKDFLSNKNHPVPVEFKQAITEMIENVETVLEEMSFNPQNIQGCFSGWLLEKLEEKGWSMRELARQTTFSVSTVSRVINEDQHPTHDFCTAVARVLGIDAAEALWRAGFHT